MPNLVQPIIRWVQASPARTRWAIRLLPDLPFTLNVPPVGRLRLRLRRHRSLWLRHPFAHEGFAINGLKRLLQPGAVVYDIGANIGVYARWLVRTHQAATVIAFEPMSENLRDLRANLALDPYAALRVTIVEAALADRDAEELLQIDDQMSASARLDRVTAGAAAPGRAKVGLGPITETVLVRRLDSIMHDLQLAPPDLIKLDVEGAELLTLQGARQTLERHRPHLVIEVHEQIELRALLNLLEPLGYNVYSWRGAHGSAAYTQLRAAHETTVHDLTTVHLLATVDPLLLREPVDAHYSDG